MARKWKADHGVTNYEDLLCVQQPQNSNDSRILMSYTFEQRQNGIKRGLVLMSLYRDTKQWNRHRAVASAWRNLWRLRHVRVH